jgi:hypothetical protein
MLMEPNVPEPNAIADPPEFNLDNMEVSGDEFPDLCILVHLDDSLMRMKKIRKLTWP